MLMAATTTNPPDVRIIEVGPRDGLQNISTTVPSSQKIELIKRLYATGLKTVEITSLVSPRAIPQLADAQHVLADTGVLSRLGDSTVRAPVLVPNAQGLDRAFRAGVKEVAVFVSATEGFSQANTRCSVTEGLRRAAEVSSVAASKDVAVRGYVSCIFADPYDGPTRRESVLHVVQELLRTGCYEVSLGDTLGVGTPAHVRSLLRYLSARGIPMQKLAGHFHDTYGQAVANVWEAYQCGIRAFDSSVSGLGGCPFAPGAKGNVATEDLVYMFEQAGIRTGVNLDRLVDVGCWIAAQLRIENHSRAGVALSKKKANTASQAPALARQSPTRLSWTLVRDTGSLQIFRSGVNIKLILSSPNGNALTTAMISDLTSFFSEAAIDTTIRRIAITGAGKFFCTGMDLGKGTSPVAQGKAESDAQYDRLTLLFNAIHDGPQVTVAAINGPAFGGGIGLAFACDIRIAVENATVTLSEVKLGLCPATISRHVIREWGSAFVREAMLSGRSVSMAELYRIGVVAKLVAAGGLDETLDEYLMRLKYAAPVASTMSKQLVELGWVNPGGREQEKGIKEIFEKMMRADGEAASGLSHFQAGRRNIDWDAVESGKLTAKL